VSAASDRAIALAVATQGQQTRAYLCVPVVSSPPGWWVCGVRAGAHAYLGPRSGVGSRVGDMMVMGFPLGEEIALRPLVLWRPSTHWAWRQRASGAGRGASVSQGPGARNPGRVRRAPARPRRGL
jgi:hypothetical protein